MGTISAPIGNSQEANLIKAALGYLREGFQPVPIPRGEKGPRLKDWQKLRLTAENLPSHFGERDNIGLLLGAPSGGIVDVDLDVPQAVELAMDFLPQTNRVHGRKSRPCSHAWYFAEPIPNPEKFSDPDGACLVEIRSTGQQTLVPPSVHPSGEVVTWERNGLPSRVDSALLRASVVRIAAATLLARHWPEKGQRHEAALALAGTLLRANWREDDVRAFVLSLARAGRDEEASERAKDVVSTARRLENAGRATGIPRLVQIFGKDVVDRLCRWLNIRPEPTFNEVANDIPSWPDSLPPEAFHGLAGEIVRTIEPHSEADPAALLTQLLVAFGNVIGRGPHFMAEADFHGTNLFMTLVGISSKGRKGVSWSHIKRLFVAVDGNWVDTRLMSGLSSGEGLIWAVRDPTEKEVPVKDKEGNIVDYKTEIDDPGVEDKRLLAFGAEFASLLKVISREGNTLSAIIRQAWDCGDLQVLTKNSPAKATNAHISIVAHITRDELVRNLSATETANGFANRFLWVCAGRSKFLPEGGRVQDGAIEPLVRRLQEAVEFARSVGEMRRDDEARAIWWRVYPELSEGKLGLLGAVTSRSEAQVMRIACLYALLDLSPIVRRTHLLAALAVWDFCEASATFIFGDQLGDPTADVILKTLRSAQDGLTRTEIRDLFQRNQTSKDIERALTLLAQYGLAKRLKEDTGGRPVERWAAVARVTTNTT